MLTLSFLALGALLLLVGVGFLGAYWDRKVPGGDEGGWRRSFAVETSAIWFPKGRDLWPMAIIFAMFAIGPILLSWVFAGVEPQQSEVPVVQLSEEKHILQGTAMWETELGGGSKVLIVKYGSERLVVTPSRLVETKMGDDVFFRAAFTQYLAGRGYIYFQISTKEVEGMVKAGFTIVP